MPLNFIHQLLSRIFLRRGWSPELIEVFPVTEARFGDYATNAPLRLAKILKIAPEEIASRITADIHFLPEMKRFSRVEFQNGFLNFSLSDGYYRELLQDILENGIWQAPKNKKALLEFISANPTGELTIGNGRGAFLGEALSKMFSFAGWRAEKEYYVNDAKVSNQMKELGSTFLGKGTTYLTPKLKKHIALLRKKKKNWRTMNPEEAGVFLASLVQKENKKFIEKTLRIKFTKWFSEETLFRKKKIEALLRDLKEKKLVYEKDNAWWLRTSTSGDDEDRVVVRSDGSPTYFLSDIAYHLDKFSRGYERIIDIWGADHQGHVKRLYAALTLLGKDTSRLSIITTQLVRLTKGGKEVRMSKRKGVFITFEEFIRAVGLEAARIIFLSHNPESHFDFDFELLKKKSEENPFYYLNYAYARIMSIFRKAKKNPSDVGFAKDDLGILFQNDEEKKLMRSMLRLPELALESEKDLRIERVLHYGIELSRVFHGFYEREKIITDDKKLTSARLALMKGLLLQYELLFSLLGSTPKKKM